MEWEDHISCKHDPKVLEKERLTKSINLLSSSKKKQDKDLVSQLRKQRSEITKSLNKNIMCEKRKYRFLKTENYPEFKGVLPTIVQSLLDARKETRKKMNNLKQDLKNITDEKSRQEIEATISILNQRQLAYKVNANSMYGALGAAKGYLPFVNGAMTVTYIGRISIEKAVNYIKNNWDDALVVYGDTDSCFINFKRFEDHTHERFSEIWKAFETVILS
jgi:DNA polymerase elongation subunit (family B)